MPPGVFSLCEAQTQLAQLIDRAAAGEAIIIAKPGVAMVRLVALDTRAIERTPGGWEGRVQIADDFDAPLPRDVLGGFGA